MNMKEICILLVDDEPRNLDSLEAVLDDPEYVLLRAGHPDQALRLLLKHEVAAIVLDIQMPEMNGIELAQLIKQTKRFREIPIIFLTAYMIEDQDKIAGYGAGAVDYLTKPINPQILRAKVAVFAELLRKTRALAELNETLETRVRERTAELEKSEAALRVAARQKDDFLAILAHELRNPLAPLRTGLDLLSTVKPRPPVMEKTLAPMNRQLDHMVRLIDDLLDVSRLNSGKLDLKLELVELGTLIDRAVEGSRGHCDRKQQVLTIDVPRDIMMNADPVRVVQILGNLLHNASKFTPVGGTIRIEAVPDGPTARIRVVDSGIGIPPPQLDVVFQMFARIDRATATADRGLGIGLALARSLAEMHGGKLTAVSDGEGHGTTFTLTLPIERQVAAAGDLDASGAPLAPAAPAMVLDVLVVEDNDDIADTLGDWLEMVGHKVRIARNGADGVALVLSAVPDVVLCDLGLPDMSGVEVCRAIRALEIATRPTMVAVTGWGREHDLRATREAGFDEHLVKPVEPDRLRAILAACGDRLVRPAP